MPGRPYEQQAQIREAIKRYLELNGMTTLQEIADYVERQTGFSIAPGTVSRHMRRLGYERSDEWRKDST